MNDNDFLIHGCEQVLRFTRVNTWDDLTEERKVQLGFNLGVVALGLQLTKAESFDPLTNAREGLISMSAFHEHLKSLIMSHGVKINETKTLRPF